MVKPENEDARSSKRTLSWSATWGGRLLAVCVVLLGTTPGYSATPKLSADLQRKPRATERLNVIIQYRQAPTAAYHQKVIRQGGSLQRELGLVKAASYSVPVKALATLAADPDVAYISPDRPVRMSSNAPSQTLDYYEPTINAPYAWQLGLNGSGIGVAVIDSGIVQLPDLGNGPQYRVVYSQDFVPGGPGGPPPPPQLAVQCPPGNGNVGAFFGTMVAATGGVAPYTFSISGGSLPPGVTFNSGVAFISGIPIAQGNYNFTIKVVDSSGNIATAPSNINVAPQGPPPPPPGPAANDQYGHGTHVAGILAGNGSASTGPPFSYTIRGLAPSVNLINLRVLDQNGSGTDSQVIAAIQTAIQLQSAYNIRVINLSLGRPVYESYTLDPLCQAVEQAWEAGIVVVVAAGNDGRNNSASTYGYGTVNAPGNDPYVITVGAMNTLGQSNRAADVPTSYTSKGPTMYDHVAKPDIVAPGNQIISLYQPPFTLNQEYPGNEAFQSLYQHNAPPPSGGHSNTYFILSGTSMATPMVSGAVALMLQEHPGLTPDQVKARLMKTAYKNLVPYSTAVDPVTNQVYNMQADMFTVGAGLLDVQAALTNTDLSPVTPGSALSPTVTQDASGNIVLSNNSSLVWGSGVWGDTVVWGVAQFSGIDSSGLSVLWGSTVCWGNNTMTGFGTVWGNTVVWGVGQPQGEATTLAINGDN